LNILGTRIEASVSSSQNWGMTRGKVLAHITPGFSFFKLVAPPLQLGVVEPYLVWGAWFPSHVSLEGIGSIQILGP
jgi:hypothetical protein